MRQHWGLYTCLFIAILSATVMAGPSSSAADFHGYIGEKNILDINYLSNTAAIITITNNHVDGFKLMLSSNAGHPSVTLHSGSGLMGAKEPALPKNRQLSSKPYSLVFPQITGATVGKKYRVQVAQGSIQSLDFDLQPI